MAETEISFSRLRSYLDCPWLFKLQYVDGRRAPPGARSALGQSLHRALAAFHQERGAGLERLLDLYQEHWVHAGFSSPEEQASYHRKGMRILEAYWPLEEARRSEILKVEAPFRFRLGPYAVRGIVDRLDRRPDGTIELVEYKSQQEPQPPEELRKNIQLRIYALGCRKGLGLAPGLVSVVYLSAARTVSIEPDPAGEAEAEALLEKVAGRMAQADYPPRPAFCPACPFRKSCEYSVCPA